MILPFERKEAFIPQKGKLIITETDDQIKLRYFTTDDLWTYIQIGHIDKATNQTEIEFFSGTILPNSYNNRQVTSNDLLSFAHGIDISRIKINDFINWLLQVSSNTEIKQEDRDLLLSAFLKYSHLLNKSNGLLQ